MKFQSDSAANCALGTLAPNTNLCGGEGGIGVGNTACPVSVPVNASQASSCESCSAKLPFSL
ncbi:hypothetical protein D3C81_1799050 [compost metagenome]